MMGLAGLLRRLRGSGAVLLIASAILFLVGAAGFEGIGFHKAATLGVGAAIVAGAIVIAFG